LPTEEIREQATRNGGHATLFKGAASEERFHPLPPVLEQIHRRIKLAFDPHGLFNPFRMSRNW
jgi:glycolate oxidase FAD binding subunit